MIIISTLVFFFFFFVWHYHKHRKKTSTDRLITKLFLISNLISLPVFIAPRISRSETIGLDVRAHLLLLPTIRVVSTRARLKPCYIVQFSHYSLSPVRKKRKKKQKNYLLRKVIAGYNTIRPPHTTYTHTYTLTRCFNCFYCRHSLI